MSSINESFLGAFGDDFLRRWAKWARSTGSPNRIALGTLTVTDNVSGFKTVCTGVSLQKVPDRTYDRTGTNVTYTLLATTITAVNRLTCQVFTGQKGSTVRALPFIIESNSTSVSVSA